MPREKRKLVDEPLRVGDRWKVCLADGAHELYESEVDALRAQHRAAAEATLNRQVQAMKRLWASELATAARSRAARFGSVSVPLSSLPIVCYHPLVEQAIDM